MDTPPTAALSSGTHHSAHSHLQSQGGRPVRCFRSEQRQRRFRRGTVSPSLFRSPRASTSKLRSQRNTALPLEAVSASLSTSSTGNSRTDGTVNRTRLHHNGHDSRLSRPRNLAVTRSAGVSRPTALLHARSNLSSTYSRRASAQPSQTSTSPQRLGVLHLSRAPPARRSSWTIRPLPSSHAVSRRRRRPKPLAYLMTATEYAVIPLRVKTPRVLNYCISVSDSRC